MDRTRIFDFFTRTLDAKIHANYEAGSISRVLNRMASARDNFIRLAEARTNRLLKDFDLLGNLSNRSNYSYTEEDIKLIFRAIAKKVQETESRFRLNMQGGHNGEFRLPR